MTELNVQSLHGKIDATRDEQPSGAGHRYRIAVSDESLNFREVFLSDPVPLGRQILEVAGAHPVDDFSLFALMSEGDFEDVRLDEEFDLRTPGIERFVY